MATNDDTSKPRRSRRNQPRATAVEVDDTPVTAADLPPPDPMPCTLEETIENARTLMLQIRGVLHCLSDVLLHSDDDDAPMHAEAARATAGWAQFAAEQLDPVKLKPLIEAVKRSGGGEPEESYPEPTAHRKNQVRESVPAYWA